MDALADSVQVFAPHNEDHLRECSQNVGMLRRVAEALDSVAPGLKSFVYSGGTRVRSLPSSITPD